MSKHSYLAAITSFLLALTYLLIPTSSLAVGRTGPAPLINQISQGASKYSFAKQIFHQLAVGHVGRVLRRSTEILGRN